MKFLVFCAVCVLLTACHTPVKSQLESDPLIASTFTAQEIADLDIILNFFETRICHAWNIPADRTLSCYDKFLEKIAVAQGTGTIYIPIAYHAQQSMYGKLSPAAFTDIWQIGKGADVETGETQYSMRINPDGNYTRFLDALRKEHLIFHAYVESFLSTQTLSGPMIEGILINYLQFDTQDVKVRLLIAMHYLTLNDMYERHGQPNPGADE